MADDPLMNALEELKKPQTFYERYGGTKTEHEMVVMPLVSAIRSLIAEVQSLRDELAEVRRE